MSKETKNAWDKSTQVMVRMTPEMLDALKADGAANERTVAQTVRLAIRQFIDRGRSDG